MPGIGGTMTMSANGGRFSLAAMLSAVIVVNDADRATLAIGAAIQGTGLLDGALVPTAAHAPVTIVGDLVVTGETRRLHLQPLVA